jgi:hypothetical protein
MTLTASTLVRALAVVAMVSTGAAMPARVGAQPTNDVPVWALVGVNASPDSQWLAIVRWGYVGGFDSRLLLADLMWAPHNAWQVVLGYVHVDPIEDGAPAAALVRAGTIWRPLRGRVYLENRVLGEHVAISDRSALARVRNRLLVSFPLGRRLRLRPFATAEFFAVREGLDAQRYQLGASRAFGRTTLEVYWTQHRPQHRESFHALGLTYYVRVD